jgi:hypothetical protein
MTGWERLGIGGLSQRFPFGSAEPLGALDDALAGIAAIDDDLSAFVAIDAGGARQLSRAGTGPARLRRTVRRPVLPHPAASRAGTAPAPGRYRPGSHRRRRAPGRSRCGLTARPRHTISGTCGFGA